MTPVPFVAAALGPIIHHPFEFGLGPLQFTGFGIAVVLGFVVAQMIGQDEMQRRGYDPTPIGDMIFGAVIGGLLGAKLYFVVILGHWDSLFARGGFVFWGGLVGGAAGVLLIAWRKRVPLWRVAEVGAPAIAAAYAVGRTGCWAVGDDYGRPWSGPLAVEFPEGAPASTAGIMSREFHQVFPPGTDPNTVVAVHPTQLYEVAMGLVMFAILWRLRRHRHAEGWLIGVYCVLAGIERFIVEFFRAKDDVLSIGITSAQLIAIFAVVFGVVILYVRRQPRESVARA
ncbi:MAG TPA: prolipoprotein diacylglyceryl transferase family protein [Gemmatimonadaceae bacterium]|nr:prolipoprotein diacylglyceryl transferase family protein [Gemmatimonadaceae bacterium]